MLLLLPLSECEYTVKNSKSCIQKVKLDKSPSNYKTVLSDVKSLFSNASLDQTNDIILSRICNNSEINTDLSRSKMKKLLYLRTKYYYSITTIWKCRRNTKIRNRHRNWDSECFLSTKLGFGLDFA